MDVCIGLLIWIWYWPALNFGILKAIQYVSLQYKRPNKALDFKFGASSLSMYLYRNQCAELVGLFLIEMHTSRSYGRTIHYSGIVRHCWSPGSTTLTDPASGIEQAMHSGVKEKNK